MEYIINLSGVKTPEEFHKRITECLDVPDYYGNNLDALNDVLTEYDSDSVFIFTEAGEMRDASPEYFGRFERLAELISEEEWNPQVIIIKDNKYDEDDVYDGSINYVWLALPRNTIFNK